MNLKEYLADGPKKMFSLLEGIITVELISIPSPYFHPYISGSMTNYEIDGTVPVSKYRVLLTLEEAERLEFVENMESTRVRYRDKYGTVCITEDRYSTKASFQRDLTFWGADFISFVDDELNECPPPSEEWEETVPEFVLVEKAK